MKHRFEIRKSAKEDLIAAMNSGEHAEEIEMELRLRAGLIMHASDRKLMEVAFVMSKEIGEDMAMVSMESLAGYLQGMAELISQRESAESGTDRFPWWLPVVLAVIALILGIVTIAMQGL